MISELGTANVNTELCDALIVSLPKRGADMAIWQRGSLEGHMKMESMLPVDVDALSPHTGAASLVSPARRCNQSVYVPGPKSALSNATDIPFD